MHPPHPRIVTLALVYLSLAFGVATPALAEVPSVSASTAPVVDADVVAAQQRIEDLASRMDARLAQDVDTRLHALADAHYASEGRWMAQHYFELASIERGVPASPTRYVAEQR